MADADIPSIALQDRLESLISAIRIADGAAADLTAEGVDDEPVDFVPGVVYVFSDKRDTAEPADFATGFPEDDQSAGESIRETFFLQYCVQPDGTETAQRMLKRIGHDLRQAVRPADAWKGLSGCQCVGLTIVIEELFTQVQPPQAEIALAIDTIEF